MSTHCKACDKPFSESEMLAKHTTPCGLEFHREECSKCYRIAMQAAHGSDWTEDDDAAGILAEVGLPEELIHEPS